MRVRSFRLAVIVVLGLFLAAVPALGGCGGNSEQEETVVTVGIMASFSGAAASAVVPQVDAFRDAVNYYQEAHPIKNLRIEFVQYDHQGNYSLTVQGYQDLKAQGMDVLYAMGPTERDMLKTFVVDDQIPVLGAYADANNVAPPWIYSPGPAYQWQAEVAFQFIADIWDYSKGVPKIGHQGSTQASSAAGQEGVDAILADPDYANKFNFVGFDKASPTNANWVNSYDKFKECDWIFTGALTGNALGTFVAQMRSYGYTGKFISDATGFAGFWPTVLANAKASDVYGCYTVCWGPIPKMDSDADWYVQAIETTTAKHSDYATRLAINSFITGWKYGQVVFDVISLAAKNVGADRVDGDAIRAAFDGINVQYQGTGNVFSFSENNHAGLKTLHASTWNPSVSKWELVNDKWYTGTTMPK